MPPILIVERDGGLADLMHDILRSNGHEPTVCDHEARALAHLRANRYGLVIRGDGIANSIAAQARARGMRTLAVTADLRRASRLARIGEPCAMRPFRVRDFEAAVLSAMRT